jgi:hypothetical protein
MYQLLMDKSLTAPIHLGKINNIHIKEVFYPPLLTPSFAFIQFSSWELNVLGLRPRTFNWQLEKVKRQIG